MKVDLSTPRSVKSRNTKQKIYDAAVSIMKKKGYEYLSVRNICQVAGISNGTFFYHFNTKEDLLSYYLQDRFDDYREAHGFNVDKLPFDRQILEYYKCYSKYMVENGIEFISNYYVPKNKALNTRGLRNDTMANEDTKIINFSCRCLINAEKEGKLKTKNTAIGYANNCCTMLKGIIFDWALNDGKVDMEQLIEEILGSYLKSIQITAE